MWLLRAEELPALQVVPRVTFGGCGVPAREEELTRLLLVDGALAYALLTSPFPGHEVDTRWVQ